MAIEGERDAKTGELKRAMREGSPDDVRRAAERMGAGLVDKASGAMNKAQSKTESAKSSDSPTGQIKDRLKSTADTAKDLKGQAEHEASAAKDASRHRGA